MIATSGNLFRGRLARGSLAFFPPAAMAPGGEKQDRGAFFSQAPELSLRRRSLRCPRRQQECLPALQFLAYNPYSCPSTKAPPVRCMPSPCPPVVSLRSKISADFQ